MRILLLLLSLMTLLYQENRPVSRDQSKNDCEAYFDKYFKMMVYNNPEVQAEYSGGTTELYKFLGKELILTNEEWEDAGKYLMITFLVDRHGKCFLKEVSKNAQNVGQIKYKVKRCISRMPLWKPAKCNEKPVAVKFNMPIRT